MHYTTQLAGKQVQAITGNIKPNHRQLVANRLLAGATITQAQFCDMTTKSGRLAPRILDLKRLGYPIEKKPHLLADGTHVAEYYLPKWFINRVHHAGLAQALDESSALELVDREMERI